MPMNVTRASFFAVLLLICAGGILASCDSTGAEEKDPPSLEFGPPLNASFPDAEAHQALLGGGQGRYAQLFLASSGADTTALFLGFGDLRSTPLSPGTYDILAADRVENQETFDGFVGLFRSEHLARIGRSVGGSVEIKQQSDGTARGSFTVEMEVSSLTGETDTVTATGSYTARSDSASVLNFLPFDEAVEIDTTDV